MVPYSREFRREALAACDAGGGTRSVALQFDVSESRVRRIKQERRETGKTAPQLTRRRTPKRAPYRGEIERLIAAHPEMTLKELQAKLAAPLSVTTLCVALRQLKLTFKKKS